MLLFLVAACGTDADAERDDRPVQAPAEAPSPMEGEAPTEGGAMTPAEEGVVTFRQAPLTAMTEAEALAAYHAEEYEVALGALRSLVQDRELAPERRFALRRAAMLCAAQLDRDDDFWDVVTAMEEDSDGGLPAVDTLTLLENLVEIRLLDHARDLVREARQRVEQHEHPEERRKLLTRVEVVEDHLEADWKLREFSIFAHSPRQPLWKVDWMSGGVRIEHGPVELSAKGLESVYPWVPDRGFEKLERESAAFLLPTGGLVLHIVPPSYWYEVDHLVVELDACGPKGRVCGLVGHVSVDLVVPFAWKDSFRGGLRVDARTDGGVAVQLDLRRGKEDWQTQLRGTIELEPTDGEPTWIVERYLADRPRSR